MSTIRVSQWARESRSDHAPNYKQYFERQRGSLKDLTEDGLTAETLQSSAAEEDKSRQQPADSNKNEFHDKKSQDEIRQLRQSLLADLQGAFSQATLGVNLLSLILARDDNDAASKSLSPEVKALLPRESVSVETRKLHVPSQSQQRLEKLRASGLEIEVLRNTVDTLDAAAERLETNVRRQKEFWQEVSKVEERGWLLTRDAQNSQNFAVRIGSIESTAPYDAMNLAQIKSLPNTDVILDLAGDISKGRRLRTLLYRKGTIIASSFPTTSDQSMGTAHLVDDLIKARDTLFDEELFHEITREASQMWNRGIKFTKRGITLPVHEDFELVIDLIGGDEPESTKVHELQQPRDPYRHLPELSAICLRILLAYAHRRRKNLRAQTPLPIKSGTITRHESTLLLPVMSRMAYQTALENIGAFFCNMKKLFSLATIDISVKNPSNLAQLTRLFGPNRYPGSSLLDNITEYISNPNPSSFELHIPNISARICVMFRIRDGGCEYRYSILDRPDNSFLARVPNNLVFQSSSEIREAAIDVIRICLVEIVQEATKNKWQSTIPQTGELQAQSESEDGSATTLHLALSESAMHAEIKVPNNLENLATKSWTIDLETKEPIDLLTELQRLGV